MRTNNQSKKSILDPAEIMKERTNIIEACLKVQLSTKLKSDGKIAKFKTEVIDSPCNRINGNFCGACGFPDKKWRLGVCNMATHLYMEPSKQGEVKKFLTPTTMTFEEFEEKKAKLNPIKQSKRGG